MTSNADSALGREWVTLHDSHERIERDSLLTRLAAVLLCALAASAVLPAPAAVALLLVLWLQEAIGRTGQARLGERILRIEALLSRGDGADNAAFQLYSEWQAGRPGSAGLIAEYGRNALRPTVAFPYAVMIILLLPVLIR